MRTYKKWVEDNLAELQKNFCEEREEEFNQFCEEEFKNHFTK